MACQYPNLFLEQPFVRYPEHVLLAVLKAIVRTASSWFPNTISRPVEKSCLKTSKSMNTTVSSRRKNNSWPPLWEVKNEISSNNIVRRLHPDGFVESSAVGLHAFSKATVQNCRIVVVFCHLLVLDNII